MRPTMRIEIEPDPSRRRKRVVVLHLPDGGTETLAYDLLPSEAARMLVPLRKALLLGVTWMREDATSYLLALHPDVSCMVEEKL